MFCVEYKQISCVTTLYSRFCSTLDETFIVTSSKLKTKMHTLIYVVCLLQIVYIATTCFAGETKTTIHTRYKTRQHFIFLVCFLSDNVHSFINIDDPYIRSCIFFPVHFLCHNVDVNMHRKTCKSRLCIDFIYVV